MLPDSQHRHRPNPDAHNNLTNLDRRDVDKKDYNKKTLELRTAPITYVADNKLTDGPLDVSTGVGAFATEGVAAAAGRRRARMAVLGCNTLVNTHVNFLPNASHVMPRQCGQRVRSVFSVSGHVAKAARFASRRNITIVNTGVSTTQSGCFVLAGDGRA